MQRPKSGHFPLHLLPQVFQTRVRMAAVMKKKEAMCRAPHVIFSWFFQCFYYSFSNPNWQQLLGHSVICCDRDQFSPLKYFDFTIQNHRMKNITNHIQELKDFQMRLGVICVSEYCVDSSSCPHGQKLYWVFSVQACKMSKLLQILNGPDMVIKSFPFLLAFFAVWAAWMLTPSENLPCW